MGIRTPDIQLAKLALYQLSYTPLLPARRGIKIIRKEKDQVVRCVPLWRTRGIVQIIFRLGVKRLPASQALAVLQPQGLDLSQGP